MKKFYLLAVAVGLFCLASCQQEELVTNDMYGDDFMSKLKFKTVQLDTAKEVTGASAEKTFLNGTIKANQSAGINIGIFSVRLARPSSDCSRGFGFCDFKWFPMFRKTEINISLNSNPMYANSFPIQMDANGNIYVKLELSNKNEGLDVHKLQPLVVEEQLQSFSTVNGEEKEMIVPEGTYSFDSSIGEFGGYRIPVKIK